MKNCKHMLGISAYRPMPAGTPKKNRCRSALLPSVIPVFFIIAVGLVLFCARSAHSQRPGNLTPGQSKPIQQTVPNEYLVTVKPGHGESAARTALSSLGVREISRVSDRLFLVKVTNDPGLAEVEKLAKLTPGIEAVQPNFIYSINVNPEVPDAPGLHRPENAH